MYFVYVLRCTGSSLYCGYTNDLVNRIKSHTGGTPNGAKYTRSHPPVKIEKVWQTDVKEDALKLEYRFKRLEKAMKEALISGSILFSDAFGDKLNGDLYSVRRDLERDIKV